MGLRKWKKVKREGMSDFGGEREGAREEAEETSQRGKEDKREGEFVCATWRPGGCSSHPRSERRRDERRTRSPVEEWRRVTQRMKRELQCGRLSLY